MLILSLLLIADALHLQDNDFKGHIPHQLFQLTSLIDFRLGHNALTGTIPPEIESIKHLEIFEAQTNSLHGKVPEVFDRLHHLRVLNLQKNSFAGSFPHTLVQCTSLRTYSILWLPTFVLLALKGSLLPNTLDPSLVQSAFL